MKKFLACFIVLLLAVSCLFVVNVKADIQTPKTEWELAYVHPGNVVVGNHSIYDNVFKKWLPGPFHDSNRATFSMVRYDIGAWIYAETEQDITQPNTVLVFCHGETEQEINEYIHSLYDHSNSYTRDISYFNHPNNIPPPPPPPPPQPCYEPTRLISDQATWVAAGSVIVGRIKILVSGDPNCLTNGVWRQMWRADCNNPAAVTINVGCYVKAFDNQTYLYNNKTVLDAKNNYCTKTGARFQDINDFVWPN